MSEPIGTDERLDKIAQLNAEIERLQAALDRADEWRKEHLYDEPCGCAYDTPDDWCLGHLPKLRELEAAQAKVERLTEALRFYADKDHYEYFPGARARAELEAKDAP